MQARQLQPDLTAAPSAKASQDRILTGQSRIMRLDEGLYALSIAGDPTPNDRLTKISAGPPADGIAVEIALSSGEFPGWLGSGGGTAIVRVPAGGGSVVVTTYGAGDGAAPSELTIARLGAPPVAKPETRPAVAPVSKTRDLDIEIALHIERQGDRKSLAHGWVGNLGQRLRIEAFGLRPLETIRPGDIEYMGFGPEGRVTPWVTDAKLCGTRGRGIPLTGFAIRLKAELQERFDVIYEGSFFDGGTSALCRNGESCIPSTVDDPLEAINLRVVDRAR
jgi:hypothetical protein